VALETFAALWHDRQQVPKDIVSVLVDLFPAFESCSFIYKDQEQRRILKAADTIGDLVRKCVQVKWDI
jgi:hypothetical protein